ncbi:hypothetical protein QYF36_022249 [Acer negundo]|nr:hypothetical protein QYF36_022249 [Acer negundo]
MSKSGFSWPVVRSWNCNCGVFEWDINTSSWPVKGMNLFRKLEKDLKVANVIYMNGRRHITSSIVVSRDLISA